MALTFTNVYDKLRENGVLVCARTPAQDLQDLKDDGSE